MTLTQRTHPKMSRIPMTSEEGVALACSAVLTLRTMKSNVPTKKKEREEKQNKCSGFASLTRVNVFGESVARAGRLLHVLRTVVGGGAAARPARRDHAKSERENEMKEKKKRKRKLTRWRIWEWRARSQSSWLPDRAPLASVKQKQHLKWKSKLSKSNFRINSRSWTARKTKSKRAN